MCRRIVITSGKGGVGKTTITAGLGVALAEANFRVLLIDADIGLNNLDVLMGIENKVVYDMADVLLGKCRLKQSIIQDERTSNLFILPSAHAVYSEEIGSKNFRMLINRLSESFDYILIDCPAGIENGFYRAVTPASEAIVVTTPHISAIKDADKVLGILQTLTLDKVSLVLNRARGDLIMSGEIIEPKEISRLLNCKLIGVIPEDDNITIYSQVGRFNENVSISKNSIRMIAQNVIGNNEEIFDVTEKYRGFWGKIKMKIRKEC